MSYEKSPLEYLYHTEKWKRTKLAVIEKCNGRCSRCGRMVTGKFITHHIKPAEKDTFYDLDNLTLLCFDCHQYVTFHDDVNRKAKHVKSVLDKKNTDLVKF